MMEVDGKDVAVGLLGLWSALIGWIGTRLHTRVDVLERESVRQNTIDAMRTEIRADLQYIRERLDKLSEPQR